MDTLLITSIIIAIFGLIVIIFGQISFRQETENKLEEDKHKEDELLIKLKEFENDLRCKLQPITKKLNENGYVFELKNNFKDSRILYLITSKGTIVSNKYIVLNNDLTLNRYYNEQYYGGEIIEYLIKLIDNAVDYIKRKEDEIKRKEDEIRIKKIEQEERIKLLNGRTEEQYKIDSLIQKISK